MDKLATVKQIIGSYSSALIAFSGGVDSTFLAKIASMVINGPILLVTAQSCVYPLSELNEAKRLARTLSLELHLLTFEITDIPGFTKNTPDRCYFCKRELFSRLLDIAQREQLSAVLEGSTVDDLSDYRPGNRAIKELHVVSPLLDAGLTKDEIRRFSAELTLETASKPSFPCLASRFPYGEPITEKKIQRVGTVEEEIRKLGFRQFRVRSHEDMARIETAPDEIEHAWKMRKELSALCKKNGFIYSAIDLDGYRTGSMNELLP